jgi:transposase-like protein
MQVVSGTNSALEESLRTGRLSCPACLGALRPWGTARERVVRLRGVADRKVRPRRARCAACRRTHVLLPDWMLLRRAYAAPVIGEAVAAHLGGKGYRRIALTLGLPETTVRDWLRAFRRNTSPPHVAGWLSSGPRH